MTSLSAQAPIKTANIPVARTVLKLATALPLFARPERVVFILPSKLVLSRPPQRA
jgi:hypothetical protein